MFDERVPGTVAQIVVNVTTTPLATGNVIARFEQAGYIDTAVAHTLTTMLTGAQSSLDRGQTSAAVNRLSALIQYINAQAGRHIATDATENGVTFNPGAILIGDIDALISQANGS